MPDIQQSRLVSMRDELRDLYRQHLGGTLFLTKEEKRHLQRILQLCVGLVFDVCVFSRKKE